MYIPPSNAEHRPDVLFDFIESSPLGALVTASADGLFATHLPLVLDRARGEHGTLEGHVARANPHHRQRMFWGKLRPKVRSAAGRSNQPTPGDALVIFQGPDAYITPAWYAAKAEHGRVVPTWNYVAVHVYGTLRFIDDPAFLQRHLPQLTARHEAGREHPWAPTDAPADYIEQMQRAIVGLEIQITRLEGKWKMSQNRSAADIDGVIRGLSTSPRAGDRETAEIVAARRPVPHTPE